MKFTKYKETGFFWENYDSVTGKGTGVHPFTGWTTLFVLIMGEQYDWRVCWDGDDGMAWNEQTDDTN